MNQSLITPKALLQYSFIALPIAFAGFPLYILAPDFYATHYGLSLSLLASLLLFIRLFDAFQDPVIGWLVDKLHGKFLLVLAFAAIVLCLSIFGIFNSLIFAPATWFFICMIFATSAYSILTIILGTQATLWTADKYTQIRIASMRELFSLIGLVVAVSTPAMLAYFVDVDAVYKWYTIILLFFMLVGFICFFKFIRKLPKKIIPHLKNISFSLMLKSLSPESLKLFSVYSLSMFASSMPAVLVVFYVRDFLNTSHLTGLFLLLYFLSGAIAINFWKKIALRFGKYTTWYIAHILAVISFFGVFFIHSGQSDLYALVCVLSGIALGADLILPPSILSDNIHTHNNTSFSGTYYAILALITKMSLALASALTLFTLDFAGFKPKAVNSQHALMVLTICYALIPCILKLISAGLIYIFFIRSQSGGKNDVSKNHTHNRSFNHV